MKREDQDKPQLERALLAAHAAGDHAALVGLYTAAGDRAEAAGDIDAACFYLTMPLSLRWTLARKRRRR